MVNVYVVTGSEDGILGVYSSKKKAKESANNYMFNAGYTVDQINYSISQFYERLDTSISSISVIIEKQEVR